MENYIMLGGQKIPLTPEQTEQLRECFGQKNIPLAQVAVGETVKIGGQEMIVLEHVADTTHLLRKNPLKGIEFGQNNNFAGSCVDAVCQKIAEELEGIVGENNILLHDVDLTSDDGLKDCGVIHRKASLLTADQYRRYVAALDLYKPKDWWWLATPLSTPAHDNDRWVKCVAPSGCVYDGLCNIDRFGVRPFCILKSDIFVSR